MEKIIEFLIKECSIPIIVTSIYFWVYDRPKYRKRIPDIKIRLYSNTQQVKKDKKNIHERIIYFYKNAHERFENKLVFEQITIEKLEERIQMNKCLSFSFGNLDYHFMRIIYFKHSDGTISKSDSNVVPVFIDKEDNCRFICQEKDLPLNILGEYNGYLIKYVIKNSRKSYVKGQRVCRFIYKKYL